MKWNKIKNNPNETEDYLVTDGFSMQVLPFNTGNGWNTNGYNDDKFIEWWNAEEITHWAELPRQPK